MNCYHSELESLKELERESSEDDGWLELEKEGTEQARKNMIFSPFYPVFGEEEITVSDSAQKLTDLIISLTTFENILPQGTPTAPFLFYIYLVESDIIFGMMRNIPASWHEQWQIKWEISCYVDGFVLSCNRPLPPEAREEILKAVGESGLKVNEEKTRYQDSRQGAIKITGLAVDGTGKVRL
ncbi:MAG: reverse transcriptase domain-containing protein, partial [Minisyncoccia bacterium]